MKKIQTSNVFLWIYALVLLFLNLLLLINNTPVWSDEVFSIKLIQLPLKELISATSQDVHPPLYYIIAKFFTLFLGNSAICFKLISIIPIIILVAYSTIWMKKRFGTFSTITFITLISLSPQISYHVEIRMYTWAMLFVTLNAMFAYDIIQTKKRSCWILFTIFGLCAAYTHYYALITVAFIYLFLFTYLLFQNRLYLKSCFYCILFTVLGYLPWLPIAIKQFTTTTSNNYWIGEITLSTLKNYIIFIFGFGKNARPLLIALCIFAFLYFLFTKEGVIMTYKKDSQMRHCHFDWEFSYRPNQDSIFIIGCQIAFWGNIFIGVILSWIFRPIFMERYIVPALGLFWLAFSISLSKCKQTFRLLKIGVFFFILLLNIYYYGRFKSAEFIRVQNTNTTIAYLEKEMLSDDIVASNMNHFNWNTLEYYLPNNTFVHLADDAVVPQNRMWYFADPDSILPSSFAATKSITFTGTYYFDWYPFDLYLIY